MVLEMAFTYPQEKSAATTWLAAQQREHLDRPVTDDSRRQTLGDDWLWIWALQGTLRLVQRDKWALLVGRERKVRETGVSSAPVPSRQPSAVRQEDAITDADHADSLKYHY